MKLTLLLLKTGQTLIAQTDELEYEPSVHLVDPMEVGGKTKVTLSRWPAHTSDTHVLLHSDALLTVCEPSIPVRDAYLSKIGKKAEDFVEDELEQPVLLNEDESIPQGEDYEPKYIEEPIY